MPSKDVQYEKKAVDTSAVSAFSKEELSEMVDTEARTNRVMRQLSRDVVNIADSPTSTYEPRSRGGLDATGVNEGTTIPEEDLSYSVDPISVSKYGKRVVINTEAEEDSMGSRVDDAVTELGVALADKEDANAYATVSDTGLTNVESRTLDTNGVMDYDAMRKLRGDIRGNEYDPDSFVIHPDHEADLLGIDQFTSADYGDAQATNTGEFGRTLNMTVYVTTAASAYSTNAGDVQGVMFDSDRAFDTVIKRTPKIERDYNVSDDKWEIAGTMRFGHGVINEEAIGHIKNA